MIKRSNLTKDNKALIKKILPEKKAVRETIGPGLFIEDCQFLVNNFMRKQKEMTDEIKYVDSFGSLVSYYKIDDKLVIKSDHLDEVEYDNVDLRYIIYEGLTMHDGHLMYFYYTKIPMSISNKMHYDGFVYIDGKVLPAFKENRFDEDISVLNCIENKCNQRENELKEQSVNK